MVLFLTIVAAFAITLFALMIGGRFFLAMLVVVAGMIVLCVLQYVLWGRPMERSKGRWSRLPR